MAWLELLKTMDIDKSIPFEMDKDIKRLAQVTDRFSKIGAKTNLKEVNLVTTISDLLLYLENRVSKKIDIKFEPENKNIVIPHNPPLLEWVIENICKNAIDAMENEGTLTIKITQKPNKVYIDISDTGKGMTPKQSRSVFQPGFTTKKRGWGLGLSLAKRIIKEYHKGKIFVLQSEVGKGSIFRVVLWR